MKLVASLITKNEMGRYLELCVEHLLSFCNEICVLDDGSDDGTFEYLDAHERINVIRNPGPAFYEHEARARQALYEHTLVSSPTYVLAIDADEFIGNPMAVRKACAEGKPVYTLSMLEIWHADTERLHYRVDGFWSSQKSIPILYRPQPGWAIRDLQLACGREPQEVVALSRRATATGSAILHLGWTRVSERVARAERYDVHDGGRFHQDRHLQSILWEEQDNKRLRLIPMAWPSGLKSIAAALSERTNR